MKIIEKVAYFTIMMTLSLILLLTYWLVYPYTPVKAQNEPFPMTKAIYKAGEPATYYAETCRNINAEVVFHPAIWSEDKKFFMNLPSSKFNIVDDCVKRVNSSIIIPDIISTGRYFLELTSEIKVNPIRTVQQTFKTQVFIVE